MAQDFKETAHLKTDPEKFRSEYERIYGKKESPWCDDCGERKCYCTCPCVRCEGLGGEIITDGHGTRKCWLCDGTGRNAR